VSSQAVKKSGAIQTDNDSLPINLEPEITAHANPMPRPTRRAAPGEMPEPI
jgi:hypothetical protein